MKKVLFCVLFIFLSVLSSCKFSANHSDGETSAQPDDLEIEMIAVPGKTFIGSTEREWEFAARGGNPL